MNTIRSILIQHHPLRIALPLVVMFVTHSGIAQNYPIVDTGQTACYDSFQQIREPHHNQAFYGQDAQYNGLQPAYRDNDNNTISYHLLIRIGIIYFYEAFA